MEKSWNTALPNKQLMSACPVESSAEAAWVAASQRGDAMAFNRLVLKWEKPIYNLSLRMLQDPDEASDATQETFCSAYKSLKRFRKDAKFSTWLYRIAVNNCISRLRRRPQAPHLSLDDECSNASISRLLPASQSHEAQVMQQEEQRQVRMALERLPAEQRAVVELKFFQELTFEQIAAVLETPISTIKSRLYSGLEILKVRLGNASLRA